jgi:hypothetical protein
LEKGAATDRRELIRILRRLRVMLAELVESPEYLPANLRPSYAAAWAELEETGHIEQAITALNGPAVDRLLAVHGLVGPQRVAKTESINEAVRERQRRGGWGPLKALIRYSRLDPWKSQRSISVARRSERVQGDHRIERGTRDRSDSRVGPFSVWRCVDGALGCANAVTSR